MGSSSSCFEGIGAPRRPKTKMTLKYFPISGRAEPIRLALILGNFQYRDERIQGSEWEEKHKKQAPWGQVPVLVVDNQVVAQSKAILRYIGKMASYNGTCLYPRDALQAAKVDELMDAFDDLWILLAPTFRISDPEQKEQARQQLFSQGGEAAQMLEIFDTVLSRSTNGYVVPEAGLTIADLTYFCFLNSIRSGFVVGLGPDLFNCYKHIMKHKEKMANIPEIKAYYADQNASNPSKAPYYEVFQPGK